VKSALPRHRITGGGICATPVVRGRVRKKNVPNSIFTVPVGLDRISPAGERHRKSAEPTMLKPFLSGLVLSVTGLGCKAQPHANPVGVRPATASSAATKDRIVKTSGGDSLIVSDSLDSENSSVQRGKSPFILPHYITEKEIPLRQW
jgi:hypothetical protein